MSSTLSIEPISSRQALRMARRAEFNRFVSRFRRNRLGMAGLAILVLLVLCAILAPVLATHDPYLPDLGKRLIVEITETSLIEDINAARTLIEYGLADSTPTVVTANGTTCQQRSVETTLAGLRTGRSRWRAERGLLEEK